MKALTVPENTELADFLLRSVEGANKTRVKQWLKFGNVSVNGRVTTKYRLPLHAGDRVEVLSQRESKARVEPLENIKIVFEDSWIVVIDKPPGLLTVATDKIQKRTAMHAVQDYLRRKQEKENFSSKKMPSRPVRDGESLPGMKPGKVTGKQAFIVHRLDRDASGLLVFARTEAVKHALQEGWEEVEKEYYAVVEGVPPQAQGTVESYLRENKILRVFSTTDKHGARHSVTHYKLIETKGRYSLLQVKLATGRKHQIRVHLSDLGTPIAGDKDYGSTANPAGRMALHAFRLRFRHPVTGQALVFETPLPESFRRILSAGTVPGPGR